MRKPLGAYDGRLRRRARKARRVIAGSLSVATHARPRFVRAFWWDGHENFGDALTPFLLPRYGLVPLLAPAREAELVGVGSILEMVDDDFTGAVWGTGLMHEKAHPLPGAMFLAVRGALTRDLLGLEPGIALGDPGLLLSRFVTVRAEARHIVIVPHGLHASDPAFAHLEVQARERHRVTRVDTAAHPMAVARQVRRASLVISSSLHGLVLADALGIPAVWVTLDVPLWGGDFKFRDHESVVHPGGSRHAHLAVDTRLDDVLQSAGCADPDLVSKASSGLEETLIRFRRLPR